MFGLPDARNETFLHPGDVTSHRNFGNVISTADIHAMAAIEYVVEVLRLRHVVLCGHTSCNAVRCALKETLMGELLDSWIVLLKFLVRSDDPELESIKDERRRATRLAGLDVDRGVDVLLANAVIQKVVRERGLRIHDILFNVVSGKVYDLGFGSARLSDPVVSVAESDGNLVGRISTTTTIVDWLGTNLRYEVKTYDVATVVDWLAPNLDYEIKTEDIDESEEI